MARPVVLAACIVIGVALVHAGTVSIDFDPSANFATFKTFALGETEIQSPRPELDNSLFVKKLSTTIRTALIARGLTEATASPDLVLDYRVAGEEVSTTRRGMPMPSGPGMRGRSSGPQSVRFTEGSLIIDLHRPGEPTPVWRGVFRDDESTGSRLVENIPNGAKKLLAQYPPKPKK
jgi:hypothetical protein